VPALGDLLRPRQSWRLAEAAASPAPAKEPAAAESGGGDGSGDASGSLDLKLKLPRRPSLDLPAVDAPSLDLPPTPQAGPVCGPIGAWQPGPPGQWLDDGSEVDSSVPVSDEQDLEEQYNKVRETGGRKGL